jgi:prevent-host-death family protein
MRVSVTEAEGQLSELVRRAQAGDDVVLTREGQPAVRLVPVLEAAKPLVDRAARRAALEAAMAGASKATPGPSAARSQDFLYDDAGYRGDRCGHVRVDGSHSA